jgi:hypothetical protein
MFMRERMRAIGKSGVGGNTRHKGHP